MQICGEKKLSYSTGGPNTKKLIFHILHLYPPLRSFTFVELIMQAPLRARDMVLCEAASTNPMQPLHLPVCIFFAAYCGSEGVLH